MNTVRIANLKSIRDSGNIELKPITLLVGKNSSGKSSFLRLFSLLRQSVEVRTRSPFLWYGQYVDFGSFKEALRYNTTPQEIVFEFSFRLTKDILDQIAPLRWHIRHLRKRLDYLIDKIISVELTLVCPRDKAYFSKIYLRLESDQILLLLNEIDQVEAFKVNDLDVISATQDFDVIYFNKTMPVLVERKRPEDDDKGRDYYSFTIGGVDSSTKAALVSKSYYLFHGNTSNSTRNRSVNRISIAEFPAFANDLTGMDSSTTFRTNLKYYSQDKEFMTSLRNLSLASVVPALLQCAEEELSLVAMNVRSIAPVRATVERYYRIQDLSVDEVDYKGQNLAMYLSGLNPQEMLNFQRWTTSNLKFCVSVAYSAGHVEVFLQEADGSNKYNLADSGFGYSQILPIVAQLWSMLNSPFRRRPRHGATSIFTIEQPELHLHPSFQANVADLLIAAIRNAKDNNIKLRLIVETHSEAIVNRIGNQIAKGKISSDDVNIVLFEKKGPNESTEISVASYNLDGYLVNWPFGFFEAEED